MLIFFRKILSGILSECPDQANVLKGDFEEISRRQKSMTNFVGGKELNAFNGGHENRKNIKYNIEA